MNNYSDELKLVTGGECISNSGQGAIGFAIFDSENRVIFKHSSSIGFTTKNGPPPAKLVH